jgi:hypothetical protein
MSALIALGTVCVGDSSKGTRRLYSLSFMLTEISLYQLPHVILHLYVFLRNLLRESLQRIVCHIYYNKIWQRIPPDPFSYYVRTPPNKRGKIGT